MSDYSHSIWGRPKDRRNDPCKGPDADVRYQRHSEDVEKVHVVMLRRNRTRKKGYKVMPAI
jgi:hypothetical protein